MFSVRFRATPGSSCRCLVPTSALQGRDKLNAKSGRLDEADGGVGVGLSLGSGFWPPRSVLGQF